MGLWFVILLLSVERAESEWSGWWMDVKKTSWRNSKRSFFMLVLGSGWSSGVGV